MMTQRKSQSLAPNSGPWHAVVDRISATDHLALFLDFDGTLTPLRARPEEAILGVDTVTLLKDLLSLPRVDVSIVTGRSLEDIRQRLPNGRISIAANHGFHIVRPLGIEWIHPLALRTVDALSTLEMALSEQLCDIRGILIENKRFTLAVHYRLVQPRLVRTVRAIVHRLVREYAQLVVTQGKKVLEVRPGVTWNKGRAILKMVRLMNMSGVVFPVVIGDDATDEDAFRALRRHGPTIHVGRSRTTAAQYSVRDVNSVLALLRAIATSRHSHIKEHR